MAWKRDKSKENAMLKSHICAFLVYDILKKLHQQIYIYIYGTIKTECHNNYNWEQLIHRVNIRYALMRETILLLIYFLLKVTPSRVFCQPKWLYW